MTIHRIDTPPPAVAPAGLRVVPRAQPDTTVVFAQLDAALAAAATLATPTTTLGFAGALEQLESAQRRLAGIRFTLITAAMHHGVARGRGFTDTSAWAAATTNTSDRSARVEVKLADTLNRRLPATLAALTSGVVSREHAHVIEHVTRTLPRGLSSEQLKSLEADLIEQAKVTDPLTLRRRARRALKKVEPDKSAVDAHEDEVLRSEEERAYDRATLSLRDNGDGTATGHFTIPTLAADILSRVLDAMAAPRRGNFGATHAQTGDTTGDHVTDDGYQRRCGQAFTELLERLPTDHLSGKTAATFVITISLEQLQGKLKAAGVDTGEAISAGAARRLACNAGLLPAVLGKQSQVIDLGRSARLFNKAQAIALATRHITCAAKGCQRPYAWTELHHRKQWAYGGTTNLNDALPLCGFHHRRIHDPHYHHKETTDPTTGLPVITFQLRKPLRT